MAAIIDEKLVEHLSWLARLDLTIEEKRRFGKQLADILKYVSLLKELKGTSEVSSGELISGILDQTRSDQPRQCLTAQQVLANAPASHQGYIKVKAVLE